MLDRGLVISTFGNASLRTHEGMLITPTSLDYRTTSPDDIVAMDLDGNRIAGVRDPSSEFRLHLAIYRARPDVRAIVHVHTLSAIAFALVSDALPPLTEEAVHFTGSVRVSPYVEAGTDELGSAAVGALGSDGRAIIMRGHGVVAIGDTLDEALTRCEIAERGAAIYMAARGAGWDGRWTST